MSGECMLLGFCLVTTKIWSDGKAPSACHSPRVLDRPCYSSQVSNGPLELLDKSVLQLSVTALFYLEDSRKIHLQGVRARRSKDAKRRGPQRAGERERALWFLFLYVFFLPRGLPYANWALSGTLFYLKSSLRSSDSPLGQSSVLFLRAFLFLVFQPPLFCTPFPYSNYLTEKFQ